MIDSDGFRPNVGIIVANPEGQVLWAKRCGQDAWQFPQGGINSGESMDEAGSARGPVNALSKARAKDLATLLQVPQIRQAVVLAGIAGAIRVRG